MRVGLIGPADREELARLAMRLEERGSEGVLLDSRAEPEIHLGSDGERACGVDLKRFGAFYVADLGLRSPRVVSADGTVELDPAALVASQRHLAQWNALLERLALRARVVNPPATWDLHGLKPWEVAVYERLGLPAPATVASSDARALLELPAAGPHGRIEKGLVGGYGYTEAFTPPADLEQARLRVAERPRMVQERIEGENVRAFVIGGELLGAAQVVAGAADEVDSRRDTARVRRITLPEEAASAAVRAAEHWGLSFAAVDFMHEPAPAPADDRWVLLECNSAPFFVQFERSTGIDVSSALADHLTERARRRSGVTSPP